MDDVLLILPVTTDSFGAVLLVLDAELVELLLGQAVPLATVVLELDLM